MPLAPWLESPKDTGGPYQVWIRYSDGTLKSLFSTVAYSSQSQAESAGIKAMSFDPAVYPPNNPLPVAFVVTRLEFVMESI
jgi:hypothetical protein